MRPCRFGIQSTYSLTRIEEGSKCVKSQHERSTSTWAHGFVGAGLYHGRVKYSCGSFPREDAFGRENGLFGYSLGGEENNACTSFGECRLESTVVAAK